MGQPTISGMPLSELRALMKVAAPASAPLEPEKINLAQSYLRDVRGIVFAPRSHGAL